MASAAMAVAPIAVFHGIDDHCPQQEWLDMISEGIDYAAPVECIEIGTGRLTSIFERIEWQVLTACHHLHNNPIFANKQINIVGISQGGLISRGIVERCEGLNVHTLFTWGGPHQGVSSYEKCQHWYCYPLIRVLGYFAEYLLL